MKTKRTLLKATGFLGVTGILLPNAWTKPLVNTVVLPAHAQTSPIPPPPPTPPTPPGNALLHISAILPNPVGGDCGPSSREIVSIANSGTADADLAGFTLDRVLLAGPETLVSLSGTIAVGQAIDYDVCQGNTAGTSARLNNTFGGVVRLTDGSSTVDIVQYPPIPNGPGEGTIISYGSTPSTTVPRSS